MTKLYSVHICLLLSRGRYFPIWNDEVGELNIGAEVTVNGERLVGDDSEDNDQHELVLAKVTKRIGADMYQEEDWNGELHEVARSSLRLRHRHTICCGHITDDKLHDHFAMQQFTTTEKYISDHYPNDLIDGRIKRLYQHSDNASQHFKSTGAI